MRVVGQALALADAVEQRRAHALAQHRGGDDAHRVVVDQRGNRPADHHLRLAAAGEPPVTRPPFHAGALRPFSAPRGRRRRRPRRHQHRDSASTRRHADHHVLAAVLALHVAGRSSRVRSVRCCAPPDHRQRAGCAPKHSRSNSWKAMVSGSSSSSAISCRITRRSRSSSSAGKVLSRTMSPSMRTKRARRRRGRACGRRCGPCRCAR